jgi:hypothetical protein
MKNKGLPRPILVRTYGDLIERTGGSPNMSGSPVYIDGKLVGAIAYGWTFTDHKVGMVTPIGDMLKLWDLPAPKPRLTDVEIKLDEDAEEEQPEDKKPEDEKPQDKDSESKKKEDISEQATPLMAAGFGERALALLTEKLRPFKLIPYAVGDAPAEETYGPLEPGSAIGVQLVRGDVSLGAMGTVTM